MGIFGVKVKLLILGSKGQLGRALCETLDSNGYQFIDMDRSSLNLEQLTRIKSVLSQCKELDCIINAAAYTAVDQAELERERADRVNHLAVAQIAEFASERAIPVIHYSTDYVFDGLSSNSYKENDPANPINHYGKTKLDGEYVLSRNCPKHIILRISWLFGLYGQNFVKTILKLAKEKESLKIVADQYACPSSADDVARVTLNLIQQLESPEFNGWGTYHYCGKSTTSWFEFANEIIRYSRNKFPLLCREIIPITSSEYVTKAKRPNFSTLNCDKIVALGIEQHDWKHYLHRLIDSMA